MQILYYVCQKFQKVANLGYFGAKQLSYSPKNCYITPGYIGFYYLRNNYSSPRLRILISGLGRPWPLALRLVLVLILYATYLPFSGYEPRHIFYDAGEYWELSTKFFQRGQFIFLDFQGRGRGYMGPLLLLPGRLLCRLTGCSILAASRVMGACWATLLFGAVLPAIWKQASTRALSGGRWLMLVGLSFALWRDYFNFPLTDFPAFTLLLLGLLAMVRSRSVWWLGAGLVLAAVLNMRPLYAIAVPAWLGFAFWVIKSEYKRVRPNSALGLPLATVSPRQVLSALRRWLALALGAALVLSPQMLLNWRHENLATPLVLVSRHDVHRDYLHVLSWGTRLQRYETGFFPNGHCVLMAPDSVGIRQLKLSGSNGFVSYAQFAAFVTRYFISVAARYSRHLFNGLDLWYPTPYPLLVHPSSQAALQGFNFAAIGLGMVHIFVILLARLRASTRVIRGSEWLVGAAILLPVLASLASQVETRYFLPLHLLLLLLAVTAQPLRWAGIGPYFRWRRLLLALILAATWLAGCWQLSRATQRLAEFDRFDLMQ